MDILFYPYLQPRRLFLSFLLVSCSVKYTVASPFPVPQVSDFLLSREVQYSSEDALILASSDQGWSSSSSSSSLDDSNLFDPTGYNNIDGGSTTNLFGSGGGGGIAGLDDNESFQVAVNPPEDDGSIHVGQEVDPTRWYEGHLEGTDIFIHCCEDIEAQLQEGCIRTRKLSFSLSLSLLVYFFRFSRFIPT